MPLLARLVITAGFIGAQVLLAGTDYALLRDRFVLPSTDGTPSVVIEEEETASSAAGVSVQQGPDIEASLAAAGLTAANTGEDSVLKEILPAEYDVEMRVLLQGDDRIAFVAWTQSPEVKTYFSALKEALQSSFSPQVRDLVDRTDEREGKPTRNILAFFDPGIHEEKMVFVRVRQRLFEFHVAPGKEEKVNGLIEALTE